MIDNSYLVTSSIAAWETRRTGRPEKRRVGFTVYLPDKHFLDAIKAEAEIRNMTVSSFMRSMIRGYFGAA